MLGIKLGRKKPVLPDLKELHTLKFAKTGSVKEKFIDKEGNVVEIFRPGLSTRLSTIGVECIQQ